MHRLIYKFNYLLYVLRQAAGGLSAGESIMEAARRECQEEASVPDHILDGLKHSGCIR